MSEGVPEGYRVREKPKSALRTLATSLLTFEFFVVFFVGLMIFGLRILPLGTVIALTAGTMVVCLLAIVLLRRPVGYWLGWLFHALLFAGGLLHAGVLLIAAIFTGLWIASIYWGRRIDRERAEWAAKNLPEGNTA